MFWDIDIQSPNIEIKELLNEINKCVDNRMVVPALYMALTIPDICGKIDYPNNSSVGQRYRDWYNKYVNPLLHPLDQYFPEAKDSISFNGKACYALRCVLLHSGETDIKDKIKIDSFYIDFRPEMIGNLYSTGSDLVPEENDDGTFSWAQKSHMLISAILIVKRIVEAANKWILEKGKTDETTTH